MMCAWRGWCLLCVVAMLIQFYFICNCTQHTKSTTRVPKKVGLIKILISRFFQIIGSKLVSFSPKKHLRIPTATQLYASAYHYCLWYFPSNIQNFNLNMNFLQKNTFLRARKERFKLDMRWYVQNRNVDVMQYKTMTDNVQSAVKVFWEWKTWRKICFNIILISQSSVFRALSPTATAAA